MIEKNLKKITSKNEKKNFMVIYTKYGVTQELKSNKSKCKVET